jgi:hypothetical protein
MSVVEIVLIVAVDVGVAVGYYYGSRDAARQQESRDRILSRLR